MSSRLQFSDALPDPGLVVAADDAVTRLDAGTYLIVVADRSPRENFHLVGPDIDRRTGRQFRGTVKWRLQIGLTVPYGSRYSYRSDLSGSNLRGTFTIR